MCIERGEVLSLAGLTAGARATPGLTQELSDRELVRLVSLGAGQGFQSDAWKALSSAKQQLQQQ